MNDRQDYQTGAREDRQDYGERARDDRMDFADDNWDDHHYGWHNDNDGEVLAGVLIGAAIVGTAAAAASTPAPATTTYITVLPCPTSAVIVNGVSYYNCSSTWYQRGHAGSQVTYMVGGPPPGY